MQLTWQTALMLSPLLIILIVVVEVVRWTVGRFLKKTSGTEYITREEFEQHKRNCISNNSDDRKELLKSIGELRRVSTNMEALVMELAIKADIPVHSVIERLQRNG